MKREIVKRILDVFISLLVVTFILPPLFLVCAVMIKLQSPKGPIIYKQLRYGKGLRQFHIFKFRTMHVNDTEAKQASKNDSRIFPFGAFLRKTSLDEFPQFLNVLFGDMSVNGPRPHLIAHDIEFKKTITNYLRRYEVTPGITGLAQVNGCRGEIVTKKDLKLRIIYDLEYVDSKSALLEFYIIFKTATQVIFPPKTAY